MALEPEHDFHIEEKVLEFSVEVVDAQFNSAGRYFLKLSIQSLATKDYSRVQLKKESASEYIYDSEVITDVVSIFDATKNCSFQEKCFTFKLPKGKGMVLELFLLDFIILMNCKIELMHITYIYYHSINFDKGII